MTSQTKSKTSKKKIEQQPQQLPSNERELLRRCITDPKWFIEHAFKVTDSEGRGLVPLVFNPIQSAYYDAVWLAGIQRELQPKPRKYGFTTIRNALGLHRTLYRPGHIFRIFLHDAKAAQQVKDQINQMYGSARKWFKRLRLNPKDFMPTCAYDNRSEFRFKELDSAVYVETAQGTAVGQGDVSHDIYMAEFAHWKNAAAIRDQIAGSLPVNFPDGRITIDFNAPLDSGGIGTEAYRMYKRARDSEAEDWNGYHLTFFGVDQFPEFYTPEFLAEKRKEFGDKFKAIYPSHHSEMWVEPGVSVFNWKDIDAAVASSERRYLRDTLPPDKLARLEFFHGVDTATGQDQGGDWQVHRTRAILDGVLRDVCPPLRTRVPQDEFAERSWARWAEYPGMMVIERNFADAVLLHWKRKGGTPHGCQLYRDRSHDVEHKSALGKVGFWTSAPSKRLLISDYQALLAEGSIDIASPNLETELKQFIWLGAINKVAGAPEGVDDMHDDEAMADMLLVQGMKRGSSKGFMV